MAEKCSNLCVKSWAATAGIMFGVYLFFAPLFAMANVNTFWFSNKMFDVLVSIYPGMGATMIGAFVGLLYGAICGAICGGLFAWIHNLAMEQFS